MVFSFARFAKILNSAVGVTSAPFFHHAHQTYPLLSIISQCFFMVSLSSVTKSLKRSTTVSISQAIFSPSFALLISHIILTIHYNAQHNSLHTLTTLSQITTVYYKFYYKNTNKSTNFKQHLYPYTFGGLYCCLSRFDNYC